jgi:hypothetical protein
VKIKVSQAEGATLDWLVAKCEGVELLDPHDNKWELCWTLLADNSGDYYAPSNDWAQGGPILTRERIQIQIDAQGNYFAVQWIKGIGYGPRVDGPTPLIAAMRCYVASKLGDEVEIPEDLK